MLSKTCADIRSVENDGPIRRLAFGRASDSAKKFDQSTAQVSSSGSRHGRPRDVVSRTSIKLSRLS
jgi:hypothetical protein